MTTGNATVTASSSMFRLRRNTSRSSAENNRNQARAGWCRAGAGSAGTSTVDTETLPGEPDEQVLQAGRGDREATDSDPGVDEFGADPYRLGVAQLGRGFVRSGLGIGEAEGDEHLDR